MSRSLSLHLAKRLGATQGGPESKGTHFHTSLTAGRILLKSLRIFLMNSVIDNLLIQLLHFHLTMCRLIGQVKYAPQ